MPPHTRSTVAPLPTFVPDDFFTWAAQANKFCKKHSTCAFCKKHSTFLVLCAVLLACAFQLGRAHERLSSLERLTSLNTRLDLCESQKLSLRKSYALAQAELRKAELTHSRKEARVEVHDMFSVLNLAKSRLLARLRGLHRHGSRRSEEQLERLEHRSQRDGENSGLE